MPRMTNRDQARRWNEQHCREARADIDALLHRTKTGSPEHSFATRLAEKLDGGLTRGLSAAEREQLAAFLREVTAAA